jgi:biotin carboxyl carrier protein
MELHIGKRVAEVELNHKQGNQVRMTVDGKVYDVDIVIADNGVCSVIYNGLSLNMEIVKMGNAKKYKVNRGFNSYDVEVVDAQDKYMRSRRKDEGRQDETITAPMPGKIVKVNVAPGDSATDGDVLIVFEAMKMQSNLKVVGDCVVREVMVAEGDSVVSGQPMIKLDIISNNEEDGQ